MLSVDHRRDAALFLCLGYRMDRQSGLTAGFRTVDLHYPSARITSDSKRVVKRDGTARNDLHVPLWLFPQLHDRSFPVVFLNLVDRGLQRLEFGGAGVCGLSLYLFCHNVKIMLFIVFGRKDVAFVTKI